MSLMKVVPPDSLRYQVFNALQLESKVSKTVEKTVIKRGAPKYIHPYGNLPPGTVSEHITYTIKLNGYQIAKVHQYRLPDGTIRGGPDSLFMRLDDIVICRQKDFPQEVN
jgi:hypothetical protein